MEIRGWGEKVIFSYSNWRSKDLLGHEYFPFQRGFKSTDWSGQGLHGGCKCCRWVMWRRMKKTHPCSSFAAFCVEWWKYWSQLLKRNKRWGFDSCTSRMIRVDRAVCARMRLSAESWIHVPKIIIEKKRGVWLLGGRCWAVSDLLPHQRAHCWWQQPLPPSCFLSAGCEGGGKTGANACFSAFFPLLIKSRLLTAVGAQEVLSSRVSEHGCAARFLLPDARWRCWAYKQLTASTILWSHDLGWYQIRAVTCSERSSLLWRGGGGGGRGMLLPLTGGGFQ